VLIRPIRPEDEPLHGKAFHEHFPKRSVYHRFSTALETGRSAPRTNG
jgi:hypothetical protein